MSKWIIDFFDTPRGVQAVGILTETGRIPYKSYDIDGSLPVKVVILALLGRLYLDGVDRQAVRLSPEVVKELEG